MCLIWKSPQSQACQLRPGLLQDPECQQSLIPVLRPEVLGIFRVGQDPASQPWGDPSVQFLCIDPHRTLRQDADRMTARMRNGKTVRAARKIGAACFGYADWRQSLPRLLPVELCQQFPSGSVTCAAGQTAGGESHTSMIPSSPSDRSLPSFSLSQPISAPRAMTTRPNRPITSREVVMGSTMSTAPMSAEIMA